MNKRQDLSTHLGCLAPRSTKAKTGLGRPAGDLIRQENMPKPGTPGPTQNHAAAPRAQNQCVGQITNAIGLWSESDLQPEGASEETSAMAEEQGVQANRLHVLMSLLKLNPYRSPGNAPTVHCQFGWSSRRRRPGFTLICQSPGVDEALRARF
jgi:hypothetical protein